MIRKIPFGKTGLTVPCVGIGCMGLSGLSDREAQAFLEKALELGCNFFDHADIYGGGECERVFSRALHTPSRREKLLLQSKCGIVPGKMYDFSKEHILASVDGILERLNTDYLDVLLLHRPDALMEPEEVAEAFDRLESAGKVRFFGVSNQKPSQIRLLQKYLSQPVAADQLQFSLTNATMVSSGLEVNLSTEGAVDRDGSVLDFCRLEGITVQAWSPFRYGFFEGVFIGSGKYPELNAVLTELAQTHQVTETAVAAAWILRHPAKIQLLSGTTKPSRLEEIVQGAGLSLTRQEWYRLYLAAGHRLP